MFKRILVPLDGSPVAERGGSVHFDLEGLRDDAERAAPALSLVMVLQTAEAGGGLRVWPTRYHGSSHANAAERRAQYTYLAYEPGDLVVFESQRLHQIEPFSGDRARITVTAHALWKDERWQVWF